MNSENTTELTDRELLERVLTKVVSLEQRFDSLERRFDTLENRFNEFEKRFDTLEQSVQTNFESFNLRLVGLEVQSETLTSLAHQALSVAYAVKGEVRALREESASHGRDIQILQRQTLKAA